MQSQTGKPRIVICATQRSGSTLLCEDLRNNGLGNAEEHYLGLVNRPSLDGIGPVLASIERAGTDAGGAFSIKIMSSYAPRIDEAMRAEGHGRGHEGEWAGLASYFKDACWIYLDRRGKVAQAVSRAVSKATGINHAVSGADAKFIPGRASIGYDASYNEKVAVTPAEIAEHLLDIAVEGEAWERFFAAHGIRPLRLAYEEIVEAPAYINEVRKRTGVAEGPVNAERKLVRLANGRSEAIAQAFLDAHAGGSAQVARIAAAPAAAPAASKPVARAVPPAPASNAATPAPAGAPSPGMPNVDMAALTKTVGEVTRRWAKTPYYDAVEQAARAQWEEMILPFIEPTPIDFSNVVELAVGHGRMTEILLGKAQHVTGIDVLQENIDFCSSRFQGRPNLTLVRNDGMTLKQIADGSVTFFFCFDSMVHFDSDVVRSYLAELNRILTPGGLAFLHHSNLDRNPGGDFQKAMHARNFMSQDLFRHYAAKSGLEVVKTKVIDWGRGERFAKSLDCLSLVRRPVAAAMRAAV